MNDLTEQKSKIWESDQAENRRATMYPGSIAEGPDLYTVPTIGSMKIIRKRKRLQASDSDLESESDRPVKKCGRSTTGGKRSATGTKRSGAGTKRSATGAKRNETLKLANVKEPPGKSGNGDAIVKPAELSGSVGKGKKGIVKVKRSQTETADMTGTVAKSGNQSVMVKAVETEPAERSGSAGKGGKGGKGMVKVKRSKTETADKAVETEPAQQWGGGGEGEKGKVRVKRARSENAEPAGGAKEMVKMSDRKPAERAGSAKEKGEMRSATEQANAKKTVEFGGNSGMNKSRHGSVGVTPGIKTVGEAGGSDVDSTRVAKPRKRKKQVDSSGGDGKPKRIK